MSEPTGPQPAQPAPPYAPAAQHAQPLYAPPEGYAAPLQGYGPWTPQAPVAAQPPSPQVRHTPAPGVVAFLLAIVAAVVAPAVAAVAGFRVGAGSRLAQLPTDASFDWSVLSPVREWVLLGEVAFWVGTVLGIWALVQGIFAIAKNRGRGWGIAAVVVAAVGPIAFGIALWSLFGLGIASNL